MVGLQLNGRIQGMGIAITLGFVVASIGQTLFLKHLFNNSATNKAQHMEARA